MFLLPLEWFAFLAAWQLWDGNRAAPETDEIVLTLLFYLGLGLLLVVPQRKPTILSALAILPLFAIAIWARRELGSNYNNTTAKIKTGPYQYTDHPIYASIFAAAVVTAFLTQTKTALLGTALIGGTFVYAAMNENEVLEIVE